MGRARKKNLRGFLAGPAKRGPKQPTTTRKTGKKLKLEEAENQLQQEMRGSSKGWTADRICGRFAELMRQKGYEDYYAVRHGVGSTAMRSWRWKFCSRWGLENTTCKQMFKARKAGEEVMPAIVASWTKFHALLDRVVQEGGLRKYTFIMNMDETAMKNVATTRVTIPREVKKKDVEDERILETEYVNFSLGLVQHTCPGLAILPMCAVHTEEADKIAVIIGLFSYRKRKQNVLVLLLVIVPFY